MGSAVIEGARKVGTDKSFGKGPGKVIPETTDGPTACHSFWEVDGGATGVTGARLSAGIVQQDWPRQWQALEPQHSRTTGEVDVTSPVETARTPCQTVKTLTKTAKSTVAAWLSRADINVVMSYSFRASAAG